jgi:hypothetical protein
MAVIKIELIGPRNEKIEAAIRPLATNRDILAWYCQWFPHMFDMARQPLHGDSRWHVPEIWEHYHQTDGYEVLILDAKDEIQGYIVMCFDYTESTEGIKTYIQFLATAPWNRRLPPAKRQFANVGKILVSIASAHGLALNKDARLELHSLPDAEGFYRRLNMEETGRTKGGLKEFRLGKEAAYDLLRFVLPLLREQ